MLNSYYNRTDNGFEFDKDMETGKFRLINQDQNIKVYDADQEIVSFEPDYSGERKSKEVSKEMVEHFLESEEVSEDFIQAAGGIDSLRIFISRLLDDQDGAK